MLLLEPGIGEALEIPTSFIDFHTDELVDHTDAALALGFFREWVAAQDDAVILGRDQCVGYKVPLYLGGVDRLENLELNDSSVYWWITGQLRLKTQQLPLGTPISRLDLT